MQTALLDPTVQVIAIAAFLAAVTPLFSQALSPVFLACLRLAQNANKRDGVLKRNTPKHGVEKQRNAPKRAKMNNLRGKQHGKRTI
jgi:hypothetical protein